MSYVSSNQMRYEKSKKFVSDQISERMAYEMFLLYEYKSKERYTISMIHNEIFDEFVFSDKEIEKYIEKAKIILYEKYKLNILKTNHLKFQKGIE